ncbi:MAG TPA: hypothetical protein VEY11_13275 [Pyrinomonadaceae bacterium]|nr:hypothetical protein [Pyrinomonadaceae bacterium]
MLRFKSPVVERIMTRLSQTIAGGILIPTFLMLVIVLTDSRESERPLLESHPFAYVLAWPFPLWKHVLPSDPAMLATAVSNFIIYSLLTYRFVRRRAKMKQLP